MTFFRPASHSTGDRFEPVEDAWSKWDDRHLRGPAVTALLARGAERALAPDEHWRPVRATFELHNPVPRAACWVAARVLKRGRTLTLVDAELFAEGKDRPLSRCRAAFVAASVGSSDAEPEPVWSPPLPAECTPPPADIIAASAGGRLYRTSTTEWSGSRSGHQNAERNVVWVCDAPVIEAEDPTPFQAAARASDLGNYVVNAGADGISYINSDVTLHLARLPEAGGVGVCSEFRAEHAGVAVGSAILFDSAGACGSSSVTSVRHQSRRLSY